MLMKPNINNYQKFFFRYCKENNIKLKNINKCRNLLIQPQSPFSEFFNDTLMSINQYEQNINIKNLKLFFKIIIIMYFIKYITNKNQIESINANFKKFNHLKDYTKYYITSTYSIVSPYDLLFSWEESNEGYDFWSKENEYFSRFIIKLFNSNYSLIDLYKWI